MKKKLVSIVLAAVMFAFVGATNVAAAQQTELCPDNPVTWHVLIVTSQMAPAPGNSISELFRERLGVNLIYTIITPDLQDQFIGVMLAGGAALPDLIATTDLEARLTQGGALLRLDDLLDTGQWPNLLYHIEPYRGRLSWRGGDVEDGLYQFPNYNRFYGDPPIMSPTHWGTGFWLQKSVLEWHGFPCLEDMTLERYFQLIEDYMEAHPTIDGMPTAGFTFPMMGRTWGMTNPPMFLAGHPNNGGVIVTDGVARIYATSQYAEDYFRFLNQAFLRGLVDPETFTRTLDEYFAVLATGRMLGMHDQRWSFGTAYDALMAEGRYERTWVATMPVFEGRTPWYADRPVLNVHQGFGIPVTSNNPELKLTFLETIMSPEWQIILNWGIEGEHFMVDEDGVFYRTPEQRANALDPIWRLNNRLDAFFDVMPKMDGTLPCGNAFAPGDQPGEFIAGLSDFNRSFLESYGKNTWTDFINDAPTNPPYYPAWQATHGDGTPAAIASTQMEEADLMWLPQIIMAPEGQFDDLWAQYVAHYALIDVAAFEASVTEFIQERIRMAQ